MTNYLITGAGGQLGNSFQSVATEFYQLQLFFPTQSEVDINKPKTLSNYYKKFPFEGIINCAAYTKVDQAETKYKEAYHINAQGLQNLIKFAEAKDLKLIHFSTDFIFDGTKGRPYLEEDTTNPLNLYGRSKLAGEAFLAKSDCQIVCFRVSWLFSPFGNNFVKTIINASKYQNELTVVDDQFGKPTYGIDLARMVLRNLDHPKLYDYSIYHFAQGPKTSWFEFAKKIIDLYAIPCKIKPVPSSKFFRVAKRPSNSLLDTNRIEKILSLSIRKWDSALEDCINKIKVNEVI